MKIMKKQKGQRRSRSLFTRRKQLSNQYTGGEQVNRQNHRNKDSHNGQNEQHGDRNERNSSATTNDHKEADDTMKQTSNDLSPYGRPSRFTTGWLRTPTLEQIKHSPAYGARNSNIVFPTPPTASAPHYSRPFLVQRQQLDRDRESIKRQQRLEIYALNKIMTELELNRFNHFCQRSGFGV